MLHSPSRTGYGTRNATLLFSVRRGVFTWTSPVVAPLGTVVLIAVPVELTSFEGESKAGGKSVKSRFTIKLSSRLRHDEVRNVG
jgi:hypothetical protein